MRAPRRSNDQGSARVLSGRLSPANQRPMPVSNSAQLNRLLKEFRALRGDLETMRLELNARDEAIRALQPQIVPVQSQSGQTPMWPPEAATQIHASSSGANGLHEIFLDVRHELQRRDDDLRETIQDFQIVLTAALAQTGPDLSKQFAYRSLIRRIREVVRSAFSPDATIIVVSKGDDELLKLGGCCAWHFPQCEDGVYAGSYPVDSAAAIAHLEELRAKGAGFLLFPPTSLWWLDHYAAFRWHLERTCRLIHRSDDTCWIFALRQPSPWARLAELIADLKTRDGRNPAILNWESGVDLASLFPECAVFEPAEPGNDTLPYLEESIDVVAVKSGEPARLEEGRRVASEAVLMLARAAGDQSGPVVTIEKRRNDVSDAWPEHQVSCATPNWGDTASTGLTVSQPDR